MLVLSYSLMIAAQNQELWVTRPPSSPMPNIDWNQIVNSNEGLFENTIIRWQRIWRLHARTLQFLYVSLRLTKQIVKPLTANFKKENQGKTSILGLVGINLRSCCPSRCDSSLVGNKPDPESQSSEWKPDRKRSGHEVKIKYHGLRYLHQLKWRDQCREKWPPYKKLPEAHFSSREDLGTASLFVTIETWDRMAPN